MNRSAPTLAILLVSLVVALLAGLGRFSSDSTRWLAWLDLFFLVAITAAAIVGVRLVFMALRRSIQKDLASFELGEEATPRMISSHRDEAEYASRRSA